ncbi:MAG: oligosaccharide flippase family protein [Bacteroides thetaiotaomicron]|nr:oligosaccharide flippase family protein [Bacteroides thetaiotaomicron]
MRSQLKMGTFLSYLQMGLGVVIGLVYTPVMIRLLGQSEYGLYNTVSSTISMLSVLSLGFNSSYIRYYSRYKTDGNEDAISKLNGLFILVFTILGAVAFVCGMFLSFHLEMVFSDGLTTDEYVLARVLMILLTINLSVSFPMSVFSDIISAHEKFIFLRLVGMIKTVFSPLVTLPLLLMGYRSIAMVTVTVVIALISDSLNMYYVIRVLHNKFIFHGFEKGIFKSLFSYTFFIALNIIIDQLNWNVDKIVIGRYKGTTEVAVYSVGYTLSSYFMSFSTAIASVFTPRIHSIVRATSDNMAEQKKSLTELFIKVGRIQFLVLGLVSSGLLLFGKEFIEVYWAGEGYTASYYVMMLLVIPLMVPLIQNVGIEIQRAQNRHQFRSIVYLAMAIINVIMSIRLCKLYGAIGSAIGTAISYVLANGIAMNIFYHKKCNIDIIKFWKTILRMSIGLVIPLLCGVLLRWKLQYLGIWTFIGSIAIYSLIYFGSMWFVSMNDSEKRLVFSVLNKFRFPHIR